MYKIGKDTIYHVDDETGEKTIFCEKVAIEKTFVDILRGKQEIEIAVHAKSGKVSDRFPRSVLTENVIGALTDYGLSLVNMPDNNVVIQKLLLHSESPQNVVFEHKQLGFTKVDGKLAFLAHHPIGIDSSLKATSEFVFPEMTAPMGTFEDWREVMVKEVVGHPNMELGFSLGVTAPIVYLLRMQKVIDTNPIFGIIGASSTAKTTLMRVIASVYGSPDETTGLLRDLNATENGFVQTLAGCQGLPAIIDEATLQPNWDFTTFLYTAPKGKSKLRCNADGTLKEQMKFFTTVIISGEKSLFNQTQKNRGLYARLAEYQLRWADGPEHAKRLRDGISKNYGTAAPYLIGWLMKHQKLISMLYKNEVKEMLKQKETNDGVEIRLLHTYALITTAAIVAKHTLRLNFDVPGIRKLLLNLHDGQFDTTTPAEAMYREIEAGILANRTKFRNKDDKKLPYGLKQDLWGQFDTYKREPVVYVTLTGLEEILNGLNRLDDTLMRQMRDEGYQVYFHDRFLKYATVGDGKPACYCFKMKMGKNPPTEEEKEYDRKMEETLARLAKEHALKKATKSCLDI